MTYDYSDAPAQRGDDLIPAGTIAALELTIRPGNAGDGGLLTRSKAGDCEMLDIEYVVIDGLYARRKLYERLVLAGITDGHAKAVEISRSKLRAMLESARGTKPDDTSAEARKARTAELGDFHGLRFLAKIGVEKGKARADGAGDYPDRNVLAVIITPDKKDWRQLEQIPAQQRLPLSVEQPTAPAPIARPAWAQSQ
jgi:hypothetical protein